MHHISECLPSEAEIKKMVKRSRKPKIPPISPERQAIFDKYGVQPSTCNHLHAQVYEAPLENLRKYIKEYGAEWVDHELTGNILIEECLKQSVKRREMIGRRADIRNRLNQKFFETFGVPLRQYFDMTFGFDVVKFDEVVKPPDGTSTADAIRSRWGEDAVHLVLELIGA